MLANLTPSAVHTVKPRTYRLRLLNGSNARIFRLAFGKSDREAVCALPYAQARRVPGQYQPATQIASRSPLARASNRQQRKQELSGQDVLRAAPR